ncbi:MAG: oligosaccharide flippase family protein [Alphaproteobacteria bacterium]|nr:oligosaccharide flippase family protein [Alphaproteobacteria bacterium]
MARLRGRMVRRVGSIFVLRLVNIALAYGLTVMLARFLGAADYGRYSFVLAVVTLGAIPGQFGIPQLLMREAASLGADGSSHRVRGLKWWGYRTSLRVTVPLVLAGLAIPLVAPWVFAGPPETHTFLVGLTLIVLLPLAAMRSGILRGLQHVFVSQLPQQIVRPLVQVLLVGAMLLAPLLGLRFLPLTPLTAMAANVVGTAIAWLLGAALLARVLPVHRGRSDFEAKPGWRASILAFGLADAMYLLDGQVGILLLGTLSTDQDVGLFKVAAQGALFVAMGYVSVITSVTPAMARAWQQGDREALRSLSTRGARFALLLAAPIAAVLMLFGEPVLNLVFGEEYQTAALPMAILVGAQLLNCAFGASTSLLNMTGHERENTRAFGISLALNLVLAAILIPQYGAQGAAVAGAASILLRNLILWRAAHRLLGIETGFWGRTSASR